MPSPCTVYKWYDTYHNILYVGITERGTKRAKEHADTKEWWYLAETCELEHYTSRRVALKREAYLISSLQPPFNIQGKKKLISDNSPVPQDNKLDLMVKLTQSEIIRALNVHHLWNTDQNAALTEWYALPTHIKRATGCVGCNKVRGLYGPLCGLCMQLKQCANCDKLLGKRFISTKYCEECINLVKCVKCEVGLGPTANKTYCTSCDPRINAESPNSREEISVLQ